MLITSTYLCAADVDGDRQMRVVRTRGEPEDVEPVLTPEQEPSVSAAMWRHIEGVPTEDLPAWAMPFEHPQDVAPEESDLDREWTEWKPGDVVYRLTHDNKMVDAVIACCLPGGVLACLPYRCRTIQLWDVGVVRGNSLCVHHVRRLQGSITLSVLRRTIARRSAHKTCDHGEGHESS